MELPNYRPHRRDRRGGDGELHHRIPTMYWKTREGRTEAISTPIRSGYLITAQVDGFLSVAYYHSLGRRAPILLRQSTAGREGELELPVYLSFTCVIKTVYKLLFNKVNINALQTKFFKPKKITLYCDLQFFLFSDGWDKSGDNNSIVRCNNHILP